MILKSMPNFLKLILSIIAIEFIILTLLRVAFFIAFKNYSSDFTITEATQAFIIGARFDLQLIIIGNLPLLIFGAIKRVSIYDSKFAKFFWISYIFITNLLVLTLYTINFPYYDFFKKTVDASIIRYFYDIGEAFKMVEEGYPVFSSLFGVLVACVILFLIYKKIFDISSKKHPATLAKRKKILISTAFVVVYIFAGYGKLEFYPWRWSEAFFSSNNFLSYLASNPVTYFVNTLKNKDVKYDKKAVKYYYDDVAEFLGVDKKDPNRLSVIRKVVPQGSDKVDAIKPNVVFVLAESMAYCRTSMSGNPLDPTPYLNSLAKEGLNYERYFSPHSGTARSVFTSMTGLVDVERMKTSSRNPMVVEQNMLLNSLKDYDKYYFIGGSLSWGNVRGVLSNVDGMITREEASYDSPNNDVWGISDADLFLELNKKLKTQTKPFFAFVQLAGNHSPWTIPENSYGFERTSGLNKQDLLDYSFDGKLEEYDGQRFMDHSIKIFIEKAKKESYFDNTIFIFVGDHGLPKKSKHMHPSAQKFSLNSVHTPLVIYAPKLIKPKNISYPVSEVDIMATVAGLGGKPYINSSFGRDILQKDFDTKDHYAFFMQHSSNSKLTLIGDEYIYIINADKSSPQLYRYYYKKEDDNLIKTYPEIAKKMQNLVLGIYESTKYTRYHNSTADVQRAVKERGLDER